MIAALLEREGVENYMVDIGGEVTSKGLNPKGECWRIGISKPEDDTTGIKNDIGQVVALCGKREMATSGNYRNFQEGGRQPSGRRPGRVVPAGRQAALRLSGARPHHGGQGGRLIRKGN